MLPQMSITDARNICKEYNLSRVINSRIKEITFHQDVLKTNYDIDVVKLHKKWLQKQKFQLDNNYLIPRDLYKSTRDKIKQLGSVSEHMKTLFKQRVKPTGNNMSVFEKKFMEKIREKQIKSRISELTWRIETATIEAERLGWYVVFNTLTVRHGLINKVFEKGSRQWNNYIQKIERDIGVAVYGTIKKAEYERKKGNLYHKYMAVVERGAKNHRLHIHVIHLMQELPQQCRRDPNLGKKQHNYRCLRGFEKYWEHGFQYPIAARFQGNDAYTKCGWVWPMEVKKSGELKPVEAKPPIAIARYLAKYINESYQQNGKDYFRCRMTRKLGLTKTKSVMKKATDEALLTMVTIGDAAPMKKAQIKVPPLRIIRMEAAREMMVRMQHKKNSSRAWKYFQGLTPAPNIIKQLRTMTRKSTKYSLSNIIDISTLNLKDGDIFNELVELWSEGGKTATSYRPSGPSSSPH